jgi:hypothetical protein
MNNTIFGNIASTLGLVQGVQAVSPIGGSLQPEAVPASYYDIFTHPPQQHLYSFDYRLKHTDSAKQQQLQGYFSPNSQAALAVSRPIAITQDTPLIAIRHIIEKAVERIFRNDPACAVNVAYTGTELACQGNNELLHDNRKKLAGMLQTLIEQAQGSGVLSPEKDAALLAGYVVSAIGGFWQSYLLSGNKAAIRDMAALLADSVTGSRSEA